MKIAHVRERHAPAGSPWRLAAALDPGEAPARWIDLDVARRRAVAARPALAHDAVLHRQPVTTLDDHLARGLRVEALRDLVDGFEPRDADDPAVLGGRRSRLRAADPAPAIVARLLRVRGARPDDVGAARRRGARGVVPPPDLLLQQRLGAARPGRRGLEPGRARRSWTTSSRWRPSSTPRPSTCRPSGPRRRSAATRSSTTGRRATSSATRRPSGSGRPRARTSRARSGRGW